MPYKTRVVPVTTNNITTGIINLLESEGHVAVRINRQGTWDEAQQRFRKSNTKKAVFDIYCCLKPNGRSLWIDVKLSKDKPSKAQLEFQKEITHAGGIAIFVSSIQQFQKEWEAIKFWYNGI
jgi:hypothetical protein